MKITKEQWNGIQNTLGDMYCDVRFKMPSGEEITINKSFVAENKMALIVWIDGVRSEGWGWPPHEDFRPLTKLIWRRKTYKPGASIIRRASKTKDGLRWLKRKESAYIHEVVEYWVCHFSTAASLVRQFRKIDGLELISPLEEVTSDAS